MFRTNKQLAEHDLRLASLALAVAELRDTIAKTLPVALRARIDELQADIEQLRVAHRSEMGKLWYRLRRDTPAPTRDDIPDDEEYRSLLELQNGFKGSN